MLTLSGLPNPKFTSTEDVGAELSISAAEVPRSNRHETFVCQTMLRDLSVRGDGVMPNSFSSLRFLSGSDARNPTQIVYNKYDKRFSLALLRERVLYHKRSEGWVCSRVYVHILPPPSLQTGQQTFIFVDGLTM